MWGSRNPNPQQFKYVAKPKERQIPQAPLENEKKEKGKKPTTTQSESDSEIKRVEENTSVIPNNNVPIPQATNLQVLLLPSSFFLPLLFFLLFFSFFF